MCIKILKSFTAIGHIQAFKVVRVQNGKFFSRYMPNYRVAQDEWIHTSSRLNSLGTDVEYKLGEVKHDMGHGFYMYADVQSAHYNCRCKDIAVLEVLIPRGAQYMTGNAYGHDAYIAREIIVLKQISKEEMDRVYGPY